MHTLLLNFLTQFKMSRTPVYPASFSKEPLDVLIVGGGLCGLAVAIATALSGHRATVFEAFENVHPFGSGVQLSPNGTRLLSAWGLDNILDGVLTTPRALRIRNLNGEILADRGDYAEDILRRYHFPMWTLHRVDLQRGLTRRATDLGVEIQYSSRVADIDSPNTTITFANGQSRRGDLVVVTNGTWPTLCRAVVGQGFVPRAVGYTAYRVTVDRSLVQDREILDLMSSTQSWLWIDQNSYAQCFPIRMGSQLSVLLITTANLSSGIESASSAVKELQKLAQGWDPM